MKIRARDVITGLESTVGLGGSPVRLLDAIERVLRESFSMPEIQAAEIAEHLEEQVKVLIIESEQTHPAPTLAIITSAKHLVAGYCHITPLDSPSVAAAKRSRLNIEPLHQEIMQLTFQQFEQFGACVLKELGAERARVTTRSNDQGIDFYGTLSLGQSSLLPTPFGQLAHDVRILFAGQAKHYPAKPIGPELLRELIGSISLARYQVFTIDREIFEDIDLLPLNPLVVMFFTTGRFTKGALELAQKSGVIAKSGEQLAVFLADRRIGMYNDGDGLRFDKALFHEWLSSS